MSTEPLKRWKRWTETTKTFPKSKYGFSQYLINIGDFVETEEMSHKDYIKVNDAAKFWAYHHKKRVKIKSLQVKPGLYVVRVTLIAKHRKRVLPEL